MAFGGGLSFGRGRPLRTSEVGTEYAHGAFSVVGRAVAGAIGRFVAEAEAHLLAIVLGGRRCLSRWAPCLERVPSVSLGASLGCLRV